MVERRAVMLSSFPVKLEQYLLELYSLKKYGTEYLESKKKVDADIRELALKAETSVVKEVRALIVLEIASSKDKKTVMKKFS